MVYGILTVIFVFFFGAAIGSFIAASACRIWNKKPIVFARSECVFCRHKLSVYDLIPVLSFIFLRGKCRKCKAPIDRGDFLVELISGALFILPVLFYWNNLFAIKNLVLILRDWIFLSSLMFLFLCDLKYKILPDAVSIPTAVVVFCINFFLGYRITDLLLGVAIGGGFFLLQYLVSRGKWVGDGDIRLGALLGAGVGFPGIILVLLLAYFFGSIAALFLLFSKKATLKSEIAFGTFLALAGTISLFFGERIIAWYLNLI